jgi:membrane fusion protein (multidrug efflux system)
MKRQTIIIGMVVVACAGLGLYALVRSHGETSASGDEEENTPSVVSVQTDVLKLKTLHHYVNGYGTVEAAPATTDLPAAGAQLAAPSAGVVARVNVVEGQHVEKGDVLIELNSGSATFDYARAEVERQTKLFAQQNTSLKNLQDAEAQLAALQIIAPLSGTLTRLNVKPGAAVDLSTVVAEVMDLNRLAVSAEIPLAQAGELQAGEEVEVLGQPPATAALSFVNPTVDTNTATVHIWSGLPANSGLRSGQFVPLQIVTAIHTNCLAAPEESVVSDVNGHSVVALVTGDEAVQTPVATGFRENGWVEITGAGLKAGDRVVTVGAYGLPDKTKIQVVNPTGK